MESQGCFNMRDVCLATVPSTCEVHDAVLLHRHCNADAVFVSSLRQQGLFVEFRVCRYM